ncbi:hypothetical protein TCAL_06802 [Tigriopus californicus]|uniref:Carboxylic ester hydrolase n=1 Tax=Tigriopus californicus TaxID=6832 RepID=A0A553PJH4_TIGCA|nr:carboxylesterase 1C-like [Tigriopus californicus]TRY77841.1 hypothetical protein TCAL_06802 [Tigriopus californicus]|eukprot:TCALIF_06802-PA protein Name:"Similar to Venom carboxylesterase-6 (Apis mellifera)" AED:0.05 eAED:0.05 QI:75/1/1/1/1/1/4/72/574
MRINTTIAVLLPLILSSTSGSIFRHPKITIPGVGRLKGSYLKSDFTKRSIDAYYGIPYGKSPEGERRFAPPQPADPLNQGDENYDATLTHYTFHPSKICAQSSSTKKGVLGSEDCLNLSVFVPSKKDRTTAGPLPVLFYIHGGAFYFGTYTGQGPKMLLEEDIILVEAHYRLGPLGFMCLPEDGIYGNMGLQDQILALKWVQQNIAAFGGDPNQVTIFGESAGSASVTLLMLSPQAEGLFHQAIGDSGSAISGWAVDNFPEASALKYAEFTKCPLTPREAMVSCLKFERTTQELVNAHEQFRNYSLARGSLGFGASTPCVQPADSDQAVLTSHPLTLLKQGKIHNSVPAIFGTLRDEGKMFLGMFVRDFLKPLGLTHNSVFLTQGLVPAVLQALNVVIDYNVVSEVVSSYFRPTELGNLDRMIPGLISLFSTYFIKESTYTFALNNAKLSPTYFYSFSYNGPNTLYYLFADDPTGNDVEMPDAVSHADELIYLFDLPLIKLNSNDTEVAKKMVKMFAEFVQHGDFGYLGTESFSVPSLDPLDPIGNPFLEMNLHSSVQDNYPSTYSLRVQSDES